MGDVGAQVRDRHPALTGGTVARDGTWQGHLSNSTLKDRCFLIPENTKALPYTLVALQHHGPQVVGKSKFCHWTALERQHSRLGILGEFHPSGQNHTFPLLFGFRALEPVLQVLPRVFQRRPPSRSSHTTVSPESP